MATSTYSTIAIIRQSINGFDSCDWTHEYRRDGEIIADEYCEGDHEDCSYCAAVRAAAEEARIYADEAILLLRGGDVDRAFRNIEQAARCERQFGDAVAYRPALQAMQVLVNGGR
jgi:hypothetical protein